MYKFFDNYYPNSDFGAAAWILTVAKQGDKKSSSMLIVYTKMTKVPNKIK